MEEDYDEALKWLRRADGAGDTLAPEAIQTVIQMRRDDEKEELDEGELPSWLPTYAKTSPKAVIPVGARVELHDVRDMNELNGKRGTVVGFVGKSMRCKVELEEEPKGPFSFRPENLTIVWEKKDEKFDIDPSKPY